MEKVKATNMIFSIIPLNIKEKLNPSSTDTLVYVMYLQWASLVTLMVILNLSKEVVGDFGCIWLPLVGGCVPFVLLYRVVRRWRKKNIKVAEGKEQKIESIEVQEKNGRKKRLDKEKSKKKVEKMSSKKKVIEKRLKKKKTEDEENIQKEAFKNVKAVEVYP